MNVNIMNIEDDDDDMNRIQSNSNITGLKKSKRKSQNLEGQERR
jgi:hypothetical protein